MPGEMREARTRRGSLAISQIAFVRSNEVGRLERSVALNLKNENISETTSRTQLRVLQR